MALEEPEVGLDVELGLDLALAVGATFLGNVDDAVEHQHRRQWQSRVAGTEQAPVRAIAQVLVGEAVALLCGQLRCPPCCGTPRVISAARRPSVTTKSEEHTSELQ